MNRQIILFSFFIFLRRVLYTTLAFFDTYILRRPISGVILAYHSVAQDNWRFSINVNVIKKQINYLRKNFVIISLKEFEAYLQGKIQYRKPFVVLTFDDGYKDVLQLKSYFAKYKINPALFVLSNSQQPNFRELGTKRKFLSIKEIKLLMRAGWEIGCHSATHANLAKLTKVELKTEIIKAKKHLEKELGIALYAFAYPRGKYSPAVLQTVKKASFTLGLTMDDGVITKGMENKLTIPRVGIDRSHSFSEFKATFSPSVIQFRKWVKGTMVGKYL